MRRRTLHTEMRALRGGRDPLHLPLKPPARERDRPLASSRVVPLDPNPAAVRVAEQTGLRSFHGHEAESHVHGTRQVSIRLTTRTSITATQPATYPTLTA